MSNRLIYSPRQAGNPVIKLITDVITVQGDKSMKADFQISENCMVLFLSLKYNGLHPEYIYKRLQNLGNVESRILLVLSDIENPMNALSALTRTCVYRDVTLLVSWSNDEAANYLTSLKLKQRRSKDQQGKLKIQKKVGNTYDEQLVDVLTKIPRVNKPDSIGLIEHYKTFQRVVRNAERVEELDGWGPTKSEQFKRSMKENFSVDNPSG